MRLRGRGAVCHSSDRGQGRLLSAGGGVGLHAIQVAKALGARVIAVTGSEAKQEAIRRAGADEVVVAPEGRYRLAMSRLTRRRGVDLFLEVVGAPTLQESLLSVGRQGRVVVAGNPLGGTAVRREGHEYTQPNQDHRQRSPPRDWPVPMSTHVDRPARRRLLVALLLFAQTARCSPDFSITGSGRILQKGG